MDVKFHLKFPWTSDYPVCSIPCGKEHTNLLELGKLQCLIEGNFDAGSRPRVVTDLDTNHYDNQNVVFFVPPTVQFKFNSASKLSCRIYLPLTTKANK